MTIGKEFQESFAIFFQLLSQHASDSNLRFLTLKLDFNEYYTMASIPPRDDHSFFSGPPPGKEEPFRP